MSALLPSDDEVMRLIDAFGAASYRLGRKSIGTSSRELELERDKAKSALLAAWNTRARPAAETEPVQDTFFVDRDLPIMAMSGDVESSRVLKLHFRRPVSDLDRKNMTQALNRYQKSLTAPPRPDREVAVKPLDLSNLLRHAFLSGRGASKKGISDADVRAWAGYDPEECPAFARIRSALLTASEPGAGYDRGRRDMLNAILELNPAIAAKIAKFAEREPDPAGRLPFDVVFWVTEVASQLGIEPKDESAAPTGGEHA